MNEAGSGVKMLNRIMATIVIVVIAGCASSAHDRRMADANEESNVGKYVMAGLAVLAVGAAAYSSGYNGGAGYAAPNVDYDWAWDLQRASNGGTVWVCRGKQSAQYANHERCAYKYQSDNTWPGY